MKSAARRLAEARSQEPSTDLPREESPQPSETRASSGTSTAPRLIRALLFSSFPSQFTADTFVAPLFTYGVSVERIYDPDRPGRETLSFTSYDVVFFVLDLSSHTTCNRVKALVEGQGVRFVLLPRKKAAWLRIIETLRANLPPMPPPAPETKRAPDSKRRIVPFRAPLVPDAELVAEPRVEEPKPSPLLLLPARSEPVVELEPAEPGPEPPEPVLAEPPAPEPVAPPSPSLEAVVPPAQGSAEHLPPDEREYVKALEEENEKLRTSIRNQEDLIRSALTRAQVAEAKAKGAAVGLLDAPVGFADALTHLNGLVRLGAVDASQVLSILASLSSKGRS